MQQQQNPARQFDTQSDVLNQFMTETRSSIINLETRMEKLATLMANQAQCNFPSTTEVNPKEHCQSITLKCGKKYEATSIEQSDEDKDQDQQAQGIVEQKQGEDKVTEDLPAKEGTPPVSIDHHIKIPYPQRLRKNNLDKQFSKFLEVFKKLHINIPFVEALEKMPSYVQFMKDILSKKRKIGEYETVALTEECSAILQRKLPQKLRDPRSWNHLYCSDSKKNQLKLGEARPTIVTLQLANRSLTHPQGIIEDVLVKVDKFIFPADFIVLDMEEDANVPIILVRPFLATGKALIDVQKGELRLRVQGEEVVFNVLKAMTYPRACDSCFSVDVVDSIVEGMKRVEDPLVLSLLEEELTEQDGNEAMEYVKWIISYGPLKRNYFEELGSVPERPLTSVEKPAVENETLPVIVSALLSEIEIDKLLRVLSMYKKAIGWTLVDIKGISPSTVMH
ncbi:uncharacterized protein LOC133779099 [Humulus lupulus]|uniref:uncharacterized protein LOC133779099 n=1 Tax=Humulus lupulus TaxID=3486 RepID=UPI002B406A7D|nr:uncharacterized protein LOC133779099 [Humulus lupulus]